MPINLATTYVSDQFFQGIFGMSRRHSFEKQFYLLKGDNYRLDLADGRWFLFRREEDGSFSDVDSLGVEVKAIASNEFELYYSKSATREYYQKSYLRLVEDSNGNSITFSYKESRLPKQELLESIENSSGASWHFSYNEQELVKELHDHTGRSWRFNYSEQKSLLRITIGGEIEESYSYSQIERANLPEQSLLSRVSDAESQTKLSFSYNKRGEVLGYAQREQSYRYLWHSLEQVEKQNGSGSSMIYGLDETKRVSAITYPDGSYVQEEWNREQGVATIRTRSGSVLVKRYDKQGRLLRVVEDEKLLEAYAYEGKNPKPISHTKGEQTTVYGYDKAFNLLEVTLANGANYVYSYTKEGLRERSIDALGSERVYQYSPEATLIKEIDAEGNETKLVYDRLGRVVSVTLADQREHQYRYNLSNQITSYINPLGEKIEFVYSKRGELLSLRDPAKRKTEFTYDVYGRVVSKTYPFLEIEEMEQEHYSYNPDDTLSTLTRVDGSTLYLNYDVNQNITKVIAQSKRGEVEALNYSYDALSNLTKAVAKQSSVLLGYNEQQRLSREEQNGIELHTLYEEKSHALSQLNFLDQMLSYAYDEIANLKSIKINQSSQIAFAYDKNGMLTQRAYPNRTKEIFHYDERHKLVEIESTDVHIAYSYNEVGEIYLKWNSKDDDAKLCRYNRRGELIQVGRDDFSYNSAGNRVEEGWEYNYKNQLTQTPKYLYGYDERGNLKSKTHRETKERTLYSFNLFNQLLSVKKQNQAQESLEEFHYAYDALNRRVKKTTIKGTTQTTHYYLYNNHNIVAILDENKKTLATIVHDKSIDTPLSITTHQNPLRELTEVEESYYHELPRAEKGFIDKKRRSRTYYYNRDHQGSIHTLTNEAGEVVESFRYNESYGTIVSHTKREETLNPYCYTGREFETEELYYYRARYYDPTIGRFISNDPIEFLAGDFNFYRYVGNSPVGWVDPWGLLSNTSATTSSTSTQQVRIPGTRQTVYSGSTSRISTPSVTDVAKKSLTPWAAFCAMCVVGYGTISSIQEDVENQGGHILSAEEDVLLSTETATLLEATVEGTVEVNGEKQRKNKCKEICFGISTSTYPSTIKDIFGTIVPKPNSGQASIPKGKIKRNGNTKKYRDAYRETTGIQVQDGTGSMHHTRPLWAGGCELCGDNLIPVKDGHTGENSLHEWWGGQLQNKSNEINEKIQACAKENGATGTAVNQCTLGTSYQPEDETKGRTLSRGEVGITTVSKCLAEAGVDLQVSIDTPCKPTR